jgi:hypothetical protein
VTVVACPPPEVESPDSNEFIDEVFQLLSSKKLSTNRLVRAASVHHLDVELSKILTRGSSHRVKLQIVGHSVSGMLSLGAVWLPASHALDVLYQYPFYVLTTAPSALGLLAKFVDRFTEVMLVGCNIGSTSSYGYAINGRTLTYTLAELLQCLVRGADDVVSGDEFDERGWYSPAAHHKKPKGWRWAEASPPVWTDRDPGLDPVPVSRPRTVISVEIRSITGTRLPVPAFQEPVMIEPTLQVACHLFDRKHLPTAIPEVSVETDQGSAQLLCGGRFLKLADTYYVVEKHPQLSSVLTQHLWMHRPGDSKATAPTLALVLAAQ